MQILLGGMKEGGGGNVREINDWDDEDFSMFHVRVVNWFQQFECLLSLDPDGIKPMDIFRDLFQQVFGHVRSFLDLHERKSG